MEETWRVKVRDVDRSRDAGDENHNDSKEEFQMKRNCVAAKQLRSGD